MNYVSLEFAIFVVLSVLMYFLFPNKKHQWVVLLVCSYAFYLYTGYGYAVYLFATTATTYLSALFMEKIEQESRKVLREYGKDWDREKKREYKNKTKKKEKLIIGTVTAFNLGILAFLKYYNFFAGSLNQLLHAGGINHSIPALKLFLPLGISFYTFQSLGYVLDVYRGKITAERNFFKVALFVSFFPQIIQGPISFYDRLAFQLYEPHRFDFTRCKYGCELILWGVFKKLVIADRAYIAIKAVTQEYLNYHGTMITFIIILYALQLYTDFSGGIDVSRGVAQIFGIQLEQNFRRPYFATSINDYWRRWHITLGAWMKEYVFYPFALSKGVTNLSKRIKKSAFGKTATGNHVAKILPAGVSSLLVFFLVGIWHGANWKYVAFGLWNGSVIMLSMLMEPIFVKMALKLKIHITSIGFSVFRRIRTLIIVMIGYVFDVAPSLSDAVCTFKLIAANQSIKTFCNEVQSLGLKIEDYLILSIGTIIVFLVSLFQEKNPKASLRIEMDKKPFAIRYCLVLFGIMAIIVFGIYGPGYDPADFVYMQF